MSEERFNKGFPRFYAQAGLADEIVIQHVEELAKYDIVTLGDIQVTRGYRKANGEVVKRIKSADPETIVLHHLNVMDRDQSPDLYEIRTKHPDWLLRDKKGNPCRAYNKVERYGKGARWAFDPRSDWKKFYAQRVVEITEAGYDGIFADNTWKYYNWEGNYWELDMTNDEWIQAWAEFLGYVKAQLGDKLLICNGDPEEKYLENSDGDMLESFMRIPLRNFWDEMERAKLVSGMGKILINHSYYANEMITDFNLFRWYYTNSLLTDGYFCYATTFDYWHPEYEIKLGAAQGEYYQKHGVYQRDFERGKVMVNPTLKDFKVKLKDEFKLWGKEKVREVKLPAYSGALLETL
jgi:hypothetical protein